MAELKDGFLNTTNNHSLEIKKLEENKMKITEQYNQKRLEEGHNKTQQMFQRHFPEGKSTQKITEETNQEVEIKKNVPKAYKNRKKRGASKNGTIPFPKRKLDIKKLAVTLVATSLIVGAAGYGISTAIDAYGEYKEKQNLEEMFLNSSYIEEYNELTKEIREELSQAVSDATDYDVTSLYEKKTINHKVIADCINNSPDPEKYMNVFITKYAKNGTKGIISGTADHVDIVNNITGAFGNTIEDKTPEEKLSKYLTEQGTKSGSIFSESPDLERDFLVNDTIEFAKKYQQQVVLDQVAKTQEGGNSK